MIKNALINSFSYKILKTISNAYAHSGIKLGLDKLSFYAGESAIGRHYDRFKSKKYCIEGSLVQKTLVKIGLFISNIMKTLNPFFARLLSGSGVYSAYTSMINSDAGGKLRGIGIFGFFFLLATMLFEIVRGLMGGLTIALTPLYSVAIIFAILAFFGRRIASVLTPVIESSFFVGLIKGLLR